jgi:hypothetical protein
MPPPRILLAAEIESLADLGAGGADALLALPPGVRTIGGVTVYRFRASALDLLKARVTEPRSSSLAARAWNLACHLRAHGVATPAPLALVEFGPAGGARDSVLAVRAPEHAEPLATWLARERRPRARRRGLRALGLALAALLRSETSLPQLGASSILVVPEEPEPGDDGGCAAARIAGLRSRPAAVRKLRLARAPVFVFCDLVGGRIARRASPARRARWLRRLGERAPPELAPRERALVARFALGLDRRARARPQTGARARTARAIASDSSASW